MEHKIYLSGPLFSQGEIAWARTVLERLRQRLDCRIIWPHEIASGSMEQIFQANLNALDECDIMVAILDGSQVDDGTAWEVGYFFSQGKKILGIRTDLRRAGEFEKSKVNLMVECSCMCVAGDLDQLCLELETHLD